MVVPFPVQQQDLSEPSRSSRLTALVRLVVIGSSRSAQRREATVDPPSGAGACTVTNLLDYRDRASSASSSAS